ncbi:MAG: hypothetical protein VW274_05380, partial [Thalassolituus sp.]
HTPWGIDFDASGNLWAVNSTDASDTDTSRGALLRYNASALNSAAVPDKTIALSSRYTLGLAIARP